MDIHARQVSVDGTTGRLLPATSLRVGDGELALVGAGEFDTTAFALVLAGRMEPTTGAVLLDGYGAPARLRALTTLVDAPGVTEPEPELRLEAVVAEELALAGQRADKRSVTDFLHARGADYRARNRFDSVPPELRTELLADLAALRSGVRVLVFDRPDRHTGNPSYWWSVASEYARRGLAVVVLCADASAVQLGVTAARLGALEQPAPLSVSTVDDEDEGEPTETETATETTTEIGYDTEVTESWTGELPELAEENR